jgi:ankyrin repeat protein
MKTLTVLMCAVGLVVFAGCGQQDESSQESATSAPKRDLHTAVVLGDFEAIRQHIEAGSDLNVLEPSRGSTPLITAAALGKTEAAKILIDGGADLDFQNSDGSTALHTAAFFCSVEIVEALLEKGADKTLKNKTGQTPLEIVELPFEVLEGAYKAFEVELRPAGVKLDYDRIKAARPKIAEMLK